MDVWLALMMITYNCQPDTRQNHLGSNSSMGRNLGRVISKDLSGFGQPVCILVKDGFMFTDTGRPGPPWAAPFLGMHAFISSALDCGGCASDCFKFLPGWTVTWNCKMDKSFLPQGSLKFPQGTLSQQQKETTTEIITQMRGKRLREIIQWVFSSA